MNKQVRRHYRRQKRRRMKLLYPIVADAVATVWWGAFCNALEKLGISSAIFSCEYTETRRKALADHLRKLPPSAPA